LSGRSGLDVEIAVVVEMLPAAETWVVLKSHFYLAVALGDEKDKCLAPGVDIGDFHPTCFVIFICDHSLFCAGRDHHDVFSDEIVPDSAREWRPDRTV
jgi:hypothetical protein